MTPKRHIRPTSSAPDGWEPFVVHALDGVEISGAVTSAREGGDIGLVLCHGFLGSWRRPQNVRLARRLADRHAVFLFDFRGHGGSKGQSTLGDREALDVHAVVGLARARGFRRVVTVGASMGAISVLREAERFGDVDGVVSISSPGRWTGHGRLARAAGVLVSTAPGRALARRVLRTDVFPEWTWSVPPVELVDGIGAPILLVHGTEDRFVPKAQAQLLYARAREPKRLLVLDGFGHAEVGYSSRFADLLLGEIEGMLSENGWGADVDGPGSSAESG